jgi:hypothetical protein
MATTTKSIVPLLATYVLILLLILLGIGFWIGYAIGRKRERRLHIE